MASWFKRRDPGGDAETKDPAADRAPRKSWSDFSGRKDLNVDSIKRVGKPVKSAELNVASYAAAARARDAKTTRADEGDDVLEAFRSDGVWDAEHIANEVVRAAPPPGKASRNVTADPEGLVAAARAMVLAAIWGEVKGVRSLASALLTQPFDAETARRADGVLRAAGTRRLELAHLNALVDISVAASGARSDAVLERASRLVGIRQHLRQLGEEKKVELSARQVLDLRPTEACLIVVDMAERRHRGGKQLPTFSQVVTLLREVDRDLVLLDPAGLFDPVKGHREVSQCSARLRRPDEAALSSFVVGRTTVAPVSPVARAVLDAYLSASPPRYTAGLRVKVIGGAAFRYC